MIIDSRSFLEFNTSHIAESINVSSSKLIRRRLQQNKACQHFDCILSLIFRFRTCYNNNCSSSSSSSNNNNNNNNSRRTAGFPIAGRSRKQSKRQARSTLRPLSWYADIFPRVCFPEQRISNIHRILFVKSNICRMRAKCK